MSDTNIQTYAITIIIIIILLQTYKHHPTSRFVTNATLQFDSTATNSSDRWPRISNSYTSLVPTGPESALVFYELKGAYGFAMPVKLINDSFVDPSGK